MESYLEQANRHICSLEGELDILRNEALELRGQLLHAGSDNVKQNFALGLVESKAT